MNAFNDKNMQKKAIILVSGGVDSSTILAMLKSENWEIYALSFRYGQRHKVELEKIGKFIKNYNPKVHKIIDLDPNFFTGSALTDTTISVPKYQSSEQLTDEIPVTYVPARNTIFLSYALGFAEMIKARDIFIGVHATDYANYPDCRPEYIKSFQHMANLATAASTNEASHNGSGITIHAPLINMTKAEIVKSGLALGVDYSQTISCYDPTPHGLSCGHCHSCLVRLKAFAENGEIDPALYVTKN